MDKYFSVKDKLALVTGSAQGLGYIYTRGLIEAGCSVVINDLNANMVNSVVDTLRKEYGSDNIYGAPFDVTDERSVKDAIANISEKIGVIDILVNNAGVQIRGPIETFPLEKWRKVMDVNVTGALITAQAVFPGMKEKGGGKIINIGSVQAELARPTITPYTASKGAMRNLTRGLATEWGRHNTQVNGISPGYFKTEMTKALYENEEFDGWLCGRTPANRWGDPDELIGVLLFLASDASNYINGQLVSVDGVMQVCV